MEYVSKGRHVNTDKMSIICQRCFQAVSITLLLRTISGHTGPIRVTMADVPGWARRDTKKALNFFRKEMPFTANF